MSPQRQARLIARYERQERPTIRSASPSQDGLAARRGIDLDRQRPVLRRTPSAGSREVNR